MSIETENSKEEIKELIEKCIRCGLCKSNCAVLRIMREECYSPRGKVILLDDKNFDRIIYECNLCKACEVKCPVNIKLCNAFIDARKVLVGQKREIHEAKDVIKNLERTGNVFGIKEKKE